MKTCTKCAKPVLARGFCSTHYSVWNRTHNPEKVKGYARKWAASNKDKILAASRKWKVNNPEKMRAYLQAYQAAHPEKLQARRRRRCLRVYGLSEESYAALLASQHGVCAICSSGETHGKSDKHFHVDHDHSTGSVRGLLCSKCNTALGLFSDSVQSLNKAIEYLQK